MAGRAVKLLSSPRIGRADFLFAIIVLNVVVIAALYRLTGPLMLSLELGLRTQIGLIGGEPSAITGLRLASDAIMLWLAARRLRDADRPGWWALGLVLLPLVLGAPGALLSLLGLAALFALPGTIGPNRYGPDPRGWTSREQHDEQQRRLHSGEL